MQVISVPHRTSTRHPFDLTFDGVKLPMTGARIKGNYGSRDTRFIPQQSWAEQGKPFPVRGAFVR